MSGNNAEAAKLLERSMRHADLFRFVVIQQDRFCVIEEVRKWLAVTFPERKITSIRLRYNGLEALQRHFEQPEGIVLIEDFEYLFEVDDVRIWLNQRRDRIADNSFSLVAFMPLGEAYLQQAIKALPDLWAYRNLLCEWTATEPLYDLFKDTEAYFGDGVVFDERWLWPKDLFTGPVEYYVDRYNDFENTVSAFTRYEKLIQQKNNQSYPSLHELFCMSLLMDNYQNCLKYSTAFLNLAKDDTTKNPLVIIGRWHLIVSHAYSYALLFEKAKVLESIDEIIQAFNVLETASLNYIESNMMYLSCLYYAIDDTKRAQEYAEDIYSKYKKPTQYPNVAYFHILSLIYHKTNDIQRSMDISFSIIKEMSFVTEPSNGYLTLAFSYNLYAYNLYKLGDFEQCLEYLNKALDFYKGIKRPDTHPSILQTQRHIEVVRKSGNRMPLNGN
jgi:tetratricopeptide (TPR) repeat protein